MTDLSIAVIGVLCVLVLAGYVWLVDRVRA
jgi:hypothetical protein